MPAEAQRNERKQVSSGSEASMGASMEAASCQQLEVHKRQAQFDIGMESDITQTLGDGPPGDPLVQGIVTNVFGPSD